MALSWYVLGVDPGETVGLCMLEVDQGRVADIGILQCHHQITLPMVEALVHWAAPFLTSDLTIATERFVVGSRAGRSSRAAAGSVTRTIVERLSAYAEMNGHGLALRSASEVKPWATNTRLEAAGIKHAGGHSADAARHALFQAVKAGHLIDPLSKEFRK